MIADAPATRVFVDLAPLAADGTNGGARPFVLHLLGEIAARAPDLELHLLVKASAAEVVAPLERMGARVHVLGRDVEEPRRLLRTRRRLPALAGLPDRASLRRLGADVLWSPLFTTGFHERGLPHLVVAYDFQELTHPAFFTETERRRRKEFRADLSRADVVIAISETTRRDGIERAGLAPARVTTVRPAVFRSPLPAPAVEERLRALGETPGGFAVYPANYWPHKNHERLLAGLAAAPGVRLVLCGALDGAREQLLARGEALGVSPRLHVLPYLPEDDVTALLQGARLLVYPSLHEGFGLPVAEALRLGTPVIASHLPALEEVAEDAALFVDPLDPASIAGALERLWGSAGERSRLVAAGRRRDARLTAEDPTGAYVTLLRQLVRR